MNKTNVYVEIERSGLLCISKVRNTMSAVILPVVLRGYETTSLL
jgi:hypothetical protein